MACNRLARPVSVQHHGNSLPIGDATLKHFNQMTEPKIIYLLHIIYKAPDGLGKRREYYTPVLALLNLFALWRGHEQKTERDENSKGKRENRNEKQAMRWRCLLAIWQFQFQFQLQFAVGLVVVGELIDFKCGCRCQQLCGNGGQ